jgi:hypothetical protein
LPREERARALLALCDLAVGFGQPHAQAGVGIRKLGGNLFECRAGLDVRFVFQDRGVDLYVSFVGDHDEVRRLLHGGRYR